MIRRRNNYSLTNPSMQSTLMRFAARIGLQYTKQTAQAIYSAWKRSGSTKTVTRATPRARVAKPSFGGGAPVAYSSRQQPRIGQGRKHVVSASELVGDVTGSVAYACTKYVLNPGLAETFPRLAREAAVWQHYRFTRLRFRYVTRTGTATDGSVIISPSYNPAEPAPADEKEASNTQDSIEDVTWSKEIVCNLKPQSMFSMGPKKQIRYFNIPGDYNVYDAGNLYICTVGQTAATTIGKLWVDYTCEFYVPQSIPTNPELREMSQFGSASFNVVGGITTNVTFGQATADLNPLEVKLDPTGIDFTLPLGCYLVMTELVITGNAGLGIPIDVQSRFANATSNLSIGYYPGLDASQIVSVSDMTVIVSTDATATYHAAVNVSGVANPAASCIYRVRFLNI